MTAAPIDAEAVAQCLRAHGLDWCYRQRTDSTNADALRHFEATRREVVAFSEAQDAGRGRRGRQWHSPPAGNIYCTLGLLKALPVERQGLLSIVTGVALCRALERVTGAEIRLKWPNDLLAAGRKLGGILIESRPHQDGRSFYAIGFGLNLALSDADLEAIAQPVTSLDRVAPEPLHRGELLIAALGELLQSIREFDAVRHRELAAEFAGYDAFHGREVEVASAGARRRGINRGIDECGRLRLETGQGIELQAAAEISLRPAPT